VKSRTRKAIAAALLIAAGLGLSACQSTDPIPTPSPSQLVGEWDHGNTSLELDVDGGFTLTNVPTGVVEQQDIGTGGTPSGPNVTIEGSWHVGSGGNDAGGAPGVQLDFEHPTTIGPNTGLTLLVPASSTTQLYVSLGHPEAGKRYVFTKQ
jgi:hypothetical protein